MKRLYMGVAAVILALVFMLPNSQVARAEEYQCRGTVGTVTLDNIFVPDGATCTLNGTRAKGTVKVGTNASLNASRINVVGNIQAEGAKNVVVQSSTIGGSIQIKQGKSANIAQNTINGNLQFDEQRGAIQASGNRIGGNLQAFKNTGGTTFKNNRIAENMQCKENSPAPTGSGNTAGSKEDQCAKL